jgi:hypothetical protein
MSQNEHFINLIAKQLQGLATPQEAEELQHLLQSDAGRQQEYVFGKRPALYSLTLPSMQTKPG